MDLFRLLFLHQNINSFRLHRSRKHIHSSNSLNPSSFRQNLLVSCADSETSEDNTQQDALPSTGDIGVAEFEMDTLNSLEVENRNDIQKTLQA